MMMMMMMMMMTTTTTTTTVDLKGSSLFSQEPILFVELPVVLTL
jgi:hypothetical protein